MNEYNYEDKKDITEEKSDLQLFEEALEASKNATYKLKLFVSGQSPRSQRAIINIKSLCERELKGRYELDVIDVYQQPEQMRAHIIIAAPTLIKELPLPIRKVIGDMSDIERLYISLDLIKKNTEV